MLYEFPKAAITKHQELGAFQQQKSILQQFWRPKVQTEGIGKSVLPPKALGNPSKALRILLRYNPSSW